MTNEQKEQMRDALLRYTGRYATQALAAESLEHISSSMISLVKNKKWDRVSEKMWSNIARQVGFYCGDDWKKADTGAYMLLRILFGDAQRYAMAYGVAIQSGLGKTFSARHYAAEQEYAHYICCDEQMNRKSFLTALLQNMNQPTTGNTEDIMQRVVSILEKQDEPLLIIDDAHQLKDRVLHFVITLYKRLINHCGIIILGNDTLRLRVIEGARMQKDMYEAIYNTIGRRFITLGQCGPRDVELICKANGIDDTILITSIKEACKGNLYQVKKMIEELKQKHIHPHLKNVVF